MKIWQCWTGYNDDVTLRSFEVRETAKCFIGNRMRFPKVRYFDDKPIDYDFASVKAETIGRLEKRIQALMECLERVKATTEGEE
jgi:hypothetical protein